MDTQEQINKLQKDLQDLTDEVYNGNFSAHQDFNKVSHFNSRIKIPVITALPTTCDVGELICSAGKLYLCSAINTWTEK